MLAKNIDVDLNFDSLFSYSAENLKLVQDLPLAEGCVHTILSDLEEPGDLSGQVTWVMTAEFDPERFAEVAMSLLESADKQRITAPGVQQFLGIMAIEDILRLIDLLVDRAEATNHILVIPTFIYRPAQYVLWPLVRQVNAYLRHKAIEKSRPLLNLARSFVARQQSDWVASAGCFSEYCDGSGLGSSMSETGMTRYVSRLLRFHVFLDSGVESPVPEDKECAPLPLWCTFSFTEKSETAEILSSFGYNLRKRKADRAAKKVARRKLSVAKGKAVKEEKRVVMGEPEKVEVMDTGDQQGDYSVLPIDAVTFRSMVAQIGTLKKELCEEKDCSKGKDKELGRIRKALDGYKSDIRLYKEEVRSMERRCHTLEREQVRQTERHYDDQMDWTDIKREFQIEIQDLQDKLEDETLKRQAIEAKFTVWEKWANQRGMDVRRAERATRRRRERASVDEEN